MKITRADIEKTINIKYEKFSKNEYFGKCGNWDCRITKTDDFDLFIIEVNHQDSDCIGLEGKCENLKDAKKTIKNFCVNFAIGVLGI